MGVVSDDKTATFARGIMGLSDKFEYKGKVKDCNSKYATQKPFYDFTINISNDHGIERIKSPITFKVVKGDNEKFIIYILADPNFNNSNIFDKSFSFKVAPIKDFKIQVGYDNDKKKPFFKYFKPNTDFDSIDANYIANARKIAEDEKQKKSPNKSIVNQIQRLKDYCLMTTHFLSLRYPQSLNTPKKSTINLVELLKYFQTEYPNYIARDFSGNINVNCKTTLIEQL